MRQDKHDTSSTRNCVIESHDPGEVPDQADGLSVLETMQAIRDGKLPPPPIARMIGFHYVRTEAGEIEIELQPEPSLEDSAGTSLAAAVVAMLDTAMSTAAATLLPSDKGAVVLDLKISYLKPLTIESGPLRAIARVIDRAGPTNYVIGQIRDKRGSPVVHAVGDISVIAGRQMLSRDQSAPSIKPGMWSTIRRTLEAMAG